MTLAHVEAFLKETIGLDAASIGGSALVRAIRERCEARGIADVESYWPELRGSAREQQELIEAVIVPETWFFRDREALAALEEWAWSNALLDMSPLRILSLPCSTGEEPYSIAMTLLDAGLSPDRFVIDAIDISERAIGHAKLGVYGRNSFRGTDLHFRDRHFAPTARGFLLSERVRHPVRLRAANLFDGSSFPAASQYEVIFCRNVLIYFDLSARQRALELLHRLLAPTGLLFVGPAEGALLGDQPFTSAGIPLAFAFHRGSSRRATNLRARPPARGTARNAPLAPVPLASPRPFSSASALPAAAEPEDGLAQARKWADEGKLDEAMKSCGQYLATHAQSVEAYYLGGLLCDARGEREEAREYYRRVLYLDPSHYEALIHLAETLKAADDKRGAEQLFERARRAQSRARSV